MRSNYDTVEGLLWIIAGAQRVVQDLYEADMIEHHQLGEAEDDIVTCGRRGMDGYRLALALERREGWDPYAAMVAILDRFEGYCAEAENPTTGKDIAA